MIGIYARAAIGNNSLSVQKKKAVEFAKSFGESHNIYEEEKSGNCIIRAKKATHSVFKRPAFRK